MKNKNGFTLIEVLATVIILAILMLFAVPQVYKYISKGKNNYYRSLEKEASVAAIDYMQDYRVLLPKQVGHVSEINISDLVDFKYIDEIKDENGDKCGGKVIVEKTKKDSYEYYACLECNTDGKVLYKTKDTNCSKSINDNVYADSDLYYLVAEQETFNVEQMSTFSSLDAHVKVYKKINDTESVPVLAEDEYLEGTPSELKVTDFVSKPIVYYYHGATLTVTINPIDNTNPSKPSVKLRKVADNKLYDGNWYSGDIEATFKSTDYASKGVEGSGIEYYEVSSDGVNFTRINGKTELLTNEGEYTRYVRSVDKKGNMSDTSSYLLKIDKTPPTCTWDGESTIWQPNLNLPEEERVNSRTITATCIDTISDCKETSKTKSKTYVDSIKTEHLSYIMYDLAGNSIDCNKEVNVYIDKTIPVITAKSNPLSRNNTRTYQFINNLNTSDAHSGIVNETISCNPAVELGTGRYNVTCEVYDAVGLKNVVTFQARHSYPGTPYSCQCNCHSVCEWRSHCNDDEYYDFYDCYYVDGLFEHCHDECSTCTCYRCPQGGSPSGSTCYY